ncbi:MAG: extracellular solute-binding protein [Acidimicrobiaceae bacterium]|nr:extracellular solute-binding protein [Acidimicrobiaceae bacterium]
MLVRQVGNKGNIGKIGKRTFALLAVGSALVASLAACSSSGGKGAGAATAGGTSAGAHQTVNIVGYSVPKPAFDALTAAFQKTPAGKNVTFHAAYGASGTESKAVAAGQPADYVVLSLEPDLTKLVPKFISPSWNAGPTKGIVTDSVVVIAVRKGNPLHIHSWADLTKPGVKIVTPDPSSSGSAKWNLLAAYESVITSGGTPAQAAQYITAFYKNVVSRASSGAIALSQFEAGTGNVLITYENSAIQARQSGQSLDYFVPSETVLIENPAAVTVTAPPAAKQFLQYTLSRAGQEIVVSKGFRPVVPGTPVGMVQGANDPSKPFPTPQHLVTVASLGGWTKVNKELFSSSGVITKIAGSS